MKKCILFLMISFGLSYATHAQSNYFATPTTTYQNAYFKKDGTFVEGHYKTTIDNTNTNNFSTKGNTNIYTDEKGSKPRDYSTEALNSGYGHYIQTGPKGGQFYINSNGNKTYVSKR